MIAPDQLATFLDDALDVESRDAIENELERDNEALQFVIEQREIDRVLRSILGAAARQQRLKESILVVVAGMSAEQLRAQVLADTSGRAAALMPVLPEGSSSAEGANASDGGRRTLWESLLSWAGFGRRGLEFSILQRLHIPLALATTRFAEVLGHCGFEISRGLEQSG